jgi:5-methylcytosine-specific restriction protein A
MDVHHRDPLAEGVRVTELADFQLLCPNCHRFVHAVMRIEDR